MTQDKSTLKEMINEIVTREEFVGAFKEVLQIVKDVKDTSSKEWQDLKDAVGKIQEELGTTSNKHQDELRKQVNQVFVGERLAEMKKLIDDKIASVKDGKDGLSIKGDKGDPGKDGIGLDGKDGSPETGLMIRNKLEKLTGDERIDASAIKGIDDRFRKLESRSTVVAIQRGQVTAYDLSASLNGVLKTFSLPTFWKVISVHLSSFPNILRPTVDYTTDAGAMTITFTSEIDAASSLATGQSLLVVYAEN